MDLPVEAEPSVSKIAVPKPTHRQTAYSSPSKARDMLTAALMASADRAALKEIFGGLSL